MAEPDLSWSASAPALVSDPEATRTTVAAFSDHFGAARVQTMPQVNASEDVGVFGAAIGVPTVFWFWGGLDTEPTLAALQQGRLDELPGNHSPFFAPVVEPTLSTGVEALTVAALTWLGPVRSPRGQGGRTMGGRARHQVRGWECGDGHGTGRVRGDGVPGEQVQRRHRS